MLMMKPNGDLMQTHTEDGCLLCQMRKRMDELLAKTQNESFDADSGHQYVMACLSVMFADEMERLGREHGWEPRKVAWFMIGSINQAMLGQGVTYMGEVLDLRNQESKEFPPLRAVIGDEVVSSDDVVVTPSSPTKH